MTAWSITAPMIACMVSIPKMNMTNYAKRIWHIGQYGKKVGRENEAENFTISIDGLGDEGERREEDEVDR